MNVTISHITAAYHWLMTPMDGLELEARERSSMLGRCPTRISQLARFDLDGYRIDDLLPELLTTDSSACPAPERFRYHTCGKDFPAGAFVLLEAGVQIASPELSFWQMSKVLPLGELVKYSDALCGRYSYTIGPDGRLVRRRAPLTTAKRLEAFARKMGSPRTNPVAFKALRTVVDNSESPMESCTTVLLCLKRMNGGMGFPKPIMGFEVELDEVGRTLTGTGTCRCDMYWRDANYDLEYDSDQEHGSASATKDALRRKAIRRAGIRVAELRTPEVMDPKLFEAAALVIAGDLSIRVRKRAQSTEFNHYQAYLDLRAQLFSWERGSSSLGRSPLLIGELDW